jgi:glycosyltransferase involved in cell wall biosynthesis
MKEMPTVSVVMITYKHEKYIEQAVEAILMQECDFKVEVIIADDCSPDNTASIITKIIKNHPNGNWVKYTTHQKNKGMIPNFIWDLQQAKGKYIALCDGDDYWIDPLKLQKQVDFLEGNEEYNISVGHYKYYYEKTKVFKNSSELFNVNKPLTLKNHIAYNFGHTSTFVFRNNFSIPEWINGVQAGDQTVFILACGEGKIKYFKDFFSVYRINNGSISFNTKAKIAKEKSEYFSLEI